MKHTITCDKIVGLIPEVGSKGQFSFFSESCHVAYQINRNNAENTMQAYILPFNSHNPWIRQLFGSLSQVGYQINRKDM